MDTAVQPKPAADITVWGIFLMVGGNTASVIAAYYGFLETISSGPFSSGGEGYGVFIFMTSAVGLTGFIMMLVGVHRFISRTDPKPSEVSEAEDQAALLRRLNSVDKPRNTSAPVQESGASEGSTGN